MASELEALGTAMETFIRHMTGVSPDVAALDVAAEADNALYLVVPDIEAMTYRSALIDTAGALADHLSDPSSSVTDKAKTMALRDKALDAAAAFQHHIELLPPSSGARNLGLE